jgi:hypothetical protein
LNDGTSDAIDFNHVSIDICNLSLVAHPRFL